MANTPTSSFRLKKDTKEIIRICCVQLDMTRDQFLDYAVRIAAETDGIILVVPTGSDDVIPIVEQVKK